MLNAFHIVHRAEFGNLKWMKNPYRLIYTLKPTGDHDQLLADDLFETLRPFAEYKEGVYTFTLQPEAFGYMKISDFCKVHGITRQWFHDKVKRALPALAYDTIRVSRNVSFVKCW